MKLEGYATRLTIFLGESDQWHHHPVYTEIVHRAQRAGLAGATVLRGVEGFGASAARLHTHRLVSLSTDLPIAVVIIDTAERIDGFLPQLDELVGGGLVVRDEVEVLVHRQGAGAPPLTWLLVALGAAIGAPCRWALARTIESRLVAVFPLGTLAVNVLGSLFLGALLGLAVEGRTGEQLLAFLGTGFCGSFTTFSTFAYESIVLVEERSSPVALASVAVSMVAGLAAAYAGWWLAGGG